MIYQKNFKLKGKKKLRLQAAGCLKDCLKKKKKWVLRLDNKTLEQVTKLCDTIDANIIMKSIVLNVELILIKGRTEILNSIFYGKLLS